MWKWLSLVITVTLVGGTIFVLIWMRQVKPASTGDYNAEFSSASFASWQQFDGEWDADQGICSDVKGGRGDKAITGLPTWRDYTLQTDLRFDSERDARWGDAGVIFRVSDAMLGTDSFNGYYAGLRVPDQSLLLSRSEDEYIELAAVRFPEPLQVGAWYHLEVRAKGCSFHITVRSVDGGNSASLSYDDLECKFRAGKVGLRTFSVPASWRHFKVQIARR